MKLSAPIIFLLLAVAGSALAPMAAAELVIHKAQGARYVSGGVTPDEVREMQTLAPRFPIQLYFHVHGSDDPVSGVNVTVRDVQGDTVLQARSDGPMFFIDITSGRYTIDAEYDGETLSETKDQTGRRYLRVKYLFKE